MDYKKLESYIKLHTQEEPQILKELNRETNLKVLRPRMLSDHIQGRTLSILSKLIHPLQILEIGTYTGYSAICLSEGLQKGGIIHTIEKNEELENIIIKYFTKSNIINKAKLYIGDAIDIIPQINASFDIVYIDADKQNYSEYLDLVLPKTRKGGLIIADNVLWNGKIIEDIDERDLDTINIMHFNKKVQECKEIENILLPIRDGLMIMLKI